MKTADLDTKEVQITRTEKRYVLNEKVFDLDNCPDWAEWAAVDADGVACWYETEPKRHSCRWNSLRYTQIFGISFDATDWEHSLIKRPEKVLEITMADLERKYGCKVKIVKEK